MNEFPVQQPSYFRANEASLLPKPEVNPNVQFFSID